MCVVALVFSRVLTASVWLFSFKQNTFVKCWRFYGANNTAVQQSDDESVDQCNCNRNVSQPIVKRSRLNCV